MYIPKSKFIIRPAKPAEFSNGYLGPVLETSTGEFFAGSSLETVSIRLTRSTDTEPIEVERPFHQYMEPTDADYQAGFYTRFFLQTDRTKRIVEVSLTQFIEKRNNEGVSAVSLVWRLIGSADKIKIENEKTVRNLTKDFPALPSLLKDPLQFVILK